MPGLFREGLPGLPVRAFERIKAVHQVDSAATQWRRAFSTALVLGFITLGMPSLSFNQMLGDSGHSKLPGLARKSSSPK